MDWPAPPTAFIRLLGLVEDRGEIMEDTARFNRLLVGVLLKLNARLTFFCKGEKMSERYGFEFPAKIIFAN